MFPGRASIRNRLTAIIMAASMISVLLTTAAVSVIGVYNMKIGMLEALSDSASIVGDRNGAALRFGQADAASANMQVLGVNADVLQACLYDNNGRVFAAYGSEAQHIAPHCPTDLSPREYIGERTLEVMKPVINKGDRVGTIYIESDLREVSAYIERQFSIAVTVTVAVLFVSYLMAVVFQQGISQPILSLAATAREVSEHKDYSVRAAPFGRRKPQEGNELKLLTDSFNGMLQEIGERDARLKRQNVELARARDAAEAASRSKSQFLANISHELRTPLNAIIGFSSILMNQLFGSLGDAKYVEYSTDIHESGSRLLEVINDILDISKADAGRLELNLEEVQVAKAIAKCVTIMAERAERGKVTVTVEAEKNLPPLVADRVRFIQILLNVLSNAVKFTGEGGNVRIIARLNKETEPPEIVIVVSDTGIGMKKEDMEKAFQSFGQIDSGLNRKYEGTGLGLPLTRKLLEAHGGDIRLESEPGAGTQVTLIFPLRPLPEGED